MRIETRETCSIGHSSWHATVQEDGYEAVAYGRTERRAIRQAKLKLREAAAIRGTLAGAVNIAERDAERARSEEAFQEAGRKQAEFYQAQAKQQAVAKRRQAAIEKRRAARA